MRVFMTLGSAPLGADRMALAEVGTPDVLISFFDYGKAYVDLSSLTNLFKDKHEEFRITGLPPQDRRLGSTGNLFDGLHSGADAHQV